jgi:hypothetical protein
MKKLIFSGCFCLILSGLLSQKLWTEADRNYLIENLTRTREMLVKETQNLTEQQWNFKELPERWSIGEVVEHIAIWELLLQARVSNSLGRGPQPAIADSARPDSIFVSFIMEEKPHISTDYTKPFTYTLPMGLHSGKDNLAWLLRMRNESIEWLETASEDLKVYPQFPGDYKNLHQVYITTFGHAERHYRQIMKIKSNPAYPKA